ncbi:NAD-dependent epimerase/dehydratase family protein [Salinimicrobium xinjiangense]|uniref:NAD-dependent epimerase/dehydratase family protein n=1 Tax=Salinimicrobium xinjiangense TaxID=438596 RepID=UPI00048AB07E|nr:NAD-dependent epimerase/dehydratase family protein [Salinimicrobium xinjiangense]
MQTILGSGGPVGNALARELKSFTPNIRLVSRHPEKVNQDDELLKADLLNSEEVINAVNGSKVVYLTAGLPYDHKIWEKDWPVIMDNVLNACEKHAAKLVFFDNVYMYDKNEIPHMTEEANIAPPSKKGKIRAEIAAELMQRVKNGKLEALIARSADFYAAEDLKNSILAETVFKPLHQGKKANWLGKADKVHSFTYVPDAAKATALLGNSEKAFGEIWHLPTAAEPPSGKEWVEMIATELGVAAKYREIPRWMIRIMGLFMPVMRETVEMFYQNDRDYIFDSSKFASVFHFEATPYYRAVTEIVEKQFSKPS